MKTKIKSIHAKAVLVEVNISFWNPVVADGSASTELHQLMDAESDAGQYTKNLLPKAAFSPIRNLSQRIRRWHYQLTLPWSDKGARILPALLQGKYGDGFRQHAAAYNALVGQQFSKESYEYYKAQAKQKLGKMYSEKQYPSLDKVLAKYGIRARYSPLPKSNDFRTHLGDNVSPEQIAEMAESVDDRLESIAEESREELCARLGAQLKHLTTTLKEYGKDDGKQRRLHGSLLENLRELCDLIPALNIADDEKVEDARAEVVARIAKRDIETLRDDEEMRNEVVADADEILKSLGLA